MDNYKVTISHRADLDLEEIYISSRYRWSFLETHKYVRDIKAQISTLDKMPQRFGFDEHTQRLKAFRSFEHKAHKVFFTIDEATKTVHVTAILPSRTKYAAKL